MLSHTAVELFITQLYSEFAVGEDDDDSDDAPLSWSQLETHS